MKLEEIKCPACNANLSIENGVEFFFCKYCGRQIHVNDEIQRSIHTKVIRDEARLREADVKQSEIEAKREIALRRMESAEKKRREDSKSIWIFMLMMLLVMVVGIALIYGSQYLFGNNSDEETKKWELTYPGAFSISPMSYNIGSKDKIVVLRLQDLQIEQVCI